MGGGASPYVDYLQLPWALAGVDSRGSKAEFGGDSGAKRTRLALHEASGGGTGIKRPRLVFSTDFGGKTDLKRPRSPARKPVRQGRLAPPSARGQDGKEG